MVRSAWDIACSIERYEIRDQGFTFSVPGGRENFLVS